MLKHLTNNKLNISSKLYKNKQYTQEIPWRQSVDMIEKTLELNIR